MIKKSVKKTLLLLCFITFSYVNLCISNQSNDQILGNDITLQNTLQFHIISPENESTYDTQPVLQYYVSISEAAVSFYINGSEIINFSNNSLLPITYRDSYNLTGTANYNGSEVIHQVIFSFFPAIKLNIYSNSIYYNDWLHPAGFYQPIPCFKFDETINFYIQPNEMRETVNVEINYKISNYEFVLGSSNFSWINDTTLNLTVEPYQENFTRHKLLFNLTSNLTKENVNSIYYFYRDVLPPLIELFPYETFTSEILSGVVFGYFRVLGSISLIVNLSVYLDGNQIYSIYNKTGLITYNIPSYYYYGVLNVTIDTTLYDNGPHMLRIIAIDFFNLTSVEEFLLTFDNTPFTPIDTNATDIHGTIFSLFWILIGVFVLSVLSRYYVKKRTIV